MQAIPHPRFLLFLLCLAGASALSALSQPAEIAAIIGFDCAAAVFLASYIPLWREAEVSGIRARAARDDGGRALLLSVAAITVAAVLVALIAMLENRSGANRRELALAALTMVLAWTFANLVYAIHYAHLYYDQIDGADRGGLDFPGTTAPVFSDFLYFAFVIGTTAQVSDVTIRLSPVRRVVLLHGALSFFFNLVVLALTVNVLASLF